MVVTWVAVAQVVVWDCLVIGVSLGKMLNPELLLMALLCESLVDQKNAVMLYKSQLVSMIGAFSAEMIS